MQESVLPFYHVGPRGQTQTAGLGESTFFCGAIPLDQSYSFLRWQNKAVGGQVISQEHSEAEASPTGLSDQWRKQEHGDSQSCRKGQSTT